MNLLAFRGWLNQWGKGKAVLRAPWLDSVRAHKTSSG